VVLLDVAGPADAFRNAAGKVPGSYRQRFVAPEPHLQAAVGLQLSALEPLPVRLAPGRSWCSRAARGSIRMNRRRGA